MSIREKIAHLEDILRTWHTHFNPEQVYEDARHDLLITVAHDVAALKDRLTPAEPPPAEPENGAE